MPAEGTLMDIVESSQTAAEPADAFLKVETHGIEPIPESERAGKARELGFLWAGAFVNYASLLTASLLTTFYGLGVWDGLLATAAGTVAGAIILGLLSNTGPRSGEPQIVFTRRIFGKRGAIVGAFLTLFLAVGWFAVDSVIAGQAGVQLLAVVGLPAGLSQALLWPLTLLVCAVSVIVAVYGHRTIKVFESWGAVAFAVLSLVLFGLLLPTIDLPLAQSQGVLAVITHHAAAFVAVPFFVFVVLGEIGANYLDVYTAGLVSLTMGIRTTRWKTALGCGILGAALASLAVLVLDFHVFYQDFLILTYLWAPAWAAVVLLAVFIVVEARPRAALLAWAAGTAVSLLFVNYPNLFANIAPGMHAFNQGLIDALHGADLSGLISLGVAIVAYLGLRRVVS